MHNGIHVPFFKKPFEKGKAFAVCRSRFCKTLLKRVKYCRLQSGKGGEFDFDHQIAIPAIFLRLERDWLTSTSRHCMHATPARALDYYYTIFQKRLTFFLDSIFFGSLRESFSKITFSRTFFSDLSSEILYLFLAEKLSFVCFVCLFVLRNPKLMHI